MTTTALSQTNNSASATHQLNLLSSASAAAAAAAAAAASNNDLTRITSSPVCSTSVVMLNSGCQPLQHYINMAANQYSRPVPMLPSVTNIFEGVPIFLLSQSSSSSPVASTLYPYSPHQRSIMEVRANVCPGNQSPKMDMSKNFHVFVGDLASEVDNCMLKAAFESFGEISEAKVIRDPQTLKSRGYGFVSFPLKMSAEKAIEEMNGQMIGRRQIRTNWAMRRFDGSEENFVKSPTYDNIFNATHPANTSVYVGGISPAITDEELMQSFSTIATVAEVRLFKQQGYAFVRYMSKEAAARAILSMNGREINGQKIRCSWSRTAMDNNVITICTYYLSKCIPFHRSNSMESKSILAPVLWTSAAAQSTFIQVMEKENTSNEC
ncbi:unnamed protein product [Litomosoides sigmodontis]|uniref:RRM domain-containing protein n=1 Tax=Litomosoides sigmodontis TaxID=42156 RepID=A0A3P6TZU2_LITSI|nr:unnamed protein product [Litomosoides sigmodontis]